MSLLDHAIAIRRLGTALVVAAAAMFTGAATAQFGEAAGIADAMQPDYFKRDVVLISQGLKLDEHQRIIVNTLFEDYQAAFEDGLNRMKKRFEDMRADLQTGDRDRVLRLVFAPFRDWSGEKHELGAQFLANVEVVLTEEQLQQWPGVQRRLYRERHLHRGKLSGESVNLLDVIRDMQLDQRTALQLQPLIEAYEVELDRALHRRDDPLIGKNNPMLQSLEQDDPNKRAQALQQYVERQVAVRNVNDQYIEQIAAALPDDLGRKFRASALDRAYPRIFRELPVQRIFKVARDLEGLTPTVRQAVIDLEAEYLYELDRMNQQLLSALRTHEPIEARDRAEDFTRRMAGQNVEPKIDPTRELFAKREEMNRSFVKRLRDLLTPEQFAMLPGANRWVEPTDMNIEATPQARQPVSKNARGASDLHGEATGPKAAETP